MWTRGWLIATLWLINFSAFDRLIEMTGLRLMDWTWATARSCRRGQRMMRGWARQSLVSCRPNKWTRLAKRALNRGTPFALRNIQCDLLFDLLICRCCGLPRRSLMSAVTGAEEVWWSVIAIRHFTGDWFQAIFTSIRSQRRPTDHFAMPRLVSPSHQLVTTTTAKVEVEVRKREVAQLLNRVGKILFLEWRGSSPWLYDVFPRKWCTSCCKLSQETRILQVLAFPWPQN